MSINVGTAIGYLELDTSKFKSGFEAAKEQLQAFTDSSNSAGDRFTSLGSGLKTIGSNMSKYFTVPIIGAGIAAGKMAMDTEHSMAKVNSILQLGSKEFEAYEKTLKQGASEIGLSYSQYADAAYDAISSGVKQADVTKFLTDANKLAKAGLTDLTSATNILTTVQNAYGEKLKDVTGKQMSMKDVSNVLIQTQALGKITVDELASSMGKIIPTANACNVSVDQLGAGYAIMTAKGIQGAEATTYMNAMLNELSKSGSKTDKALREISGKSFAQLSAEGKTTGDILEILSKHAEKSGLTLSDMFGSAEAGKAALTLLSDGAEGFNESLKAMTSDSEACNKAFNELNGTAKEQLSQSFNSFKNALSDLGTAMEPVIRFVADIITQFSNWISMMAQTNPGLLNFTAILAGVLTSMGPLLILIGQMSIGIGALANAFSLLSLAKLKDIAQTIYLHLLYVKDAILKGLSTAATWAQIAATTAWNAICIIATTVTTALGMAIAFLTSPIGLVILAIGALIAIGVLLYKNWDTIKAKCTEIWQNSIKPTIDTVMNGIKTVITTVGTAISTFLTNSWNTIKNTTTTVWNGVKTSISNVWNSIKTSISIAVNAVKSTISRVWSTLTSILTRPFQTAKSIISGILGGITSAINRVTSGIKKATSFFRMIEDPVSQQEGIQTYSNEIDYSKARFNYATARQTTVSDVIATNYSMLEGIKDFTKDIKLDTNTPKTPVQSEINVYVSVDKVDCNDKQDISQLAEELAFYIKRKTIF